MSAADRLRNAAAALRRDGGADALAVACDIERYLEDAAIGLTLDIALGVSPAPGATPWWETEKRERRNAAIRELRERYFGNVGITAAARAIEEEARRYQAATWRHDRGREKNASGDERRKLLGAALGTGLPFPGSRQLRTILGNQ
jgi:hypothetical protein